MDTVPPGKTSRRAPDLAPGAVPGFGLLPPGICPWFHSPPPPGGGERSGVLSPAFPHCCAEVGGGWWLSALLLPSGAACFLFHCGVFLLFSAGNIFLPPTPTLRSLLCRLEV